MLTPFERNLQLAEEYANQHGLTVEEAFKEVLFEKIEDEYDIEIANESYAEYLRDGEKSYSLEEVMRDLNITHRDLDEVYNKSFGER